MTLLTLKKNLETKTKTLAPSSRDQDFDEMVSKLRRQTETLTK